MPNKNAELGQGGITVVEHLAYHQKVKGLSPTFRTPDTPREKNVETLTKDKHSSFFYYVIRDRIIKLSKQFMVPLGNTPSHA